VNTPIQRCYIRRVTAGIHRTRSAANRGLREAGSGENKKTDSGDQVSFVSMRQRMELRGAFIGGYCYCCYCHGPKHNKPFERPASFNHARS
jgi:hypothetical protein